MIEYPSIIGPTKAPKKHCIAFEKLDGSNCRVKFTKKQGFTLFGSRTELFDESHAFLGEMVALFKKEHQGPLEELIRNNFPDVQQATVYGEFLGEKSFAGTHQEGDPKKFVPFDLMIGHHEPKFLLPQEFISLFQKYGIKIPRIIYEGSFNEELIQRVRQGQYDVFEGIVCKGTQRSGAFRGNVWMAKIKTQSYLELLKNRFGEEGIEKYGEE